jgi:hypothetical protein
MDWTAALLASIGGVLIGLAAISLMYFNGRIAGISGIVSGVLSPKPGDTLWRTLFLGGMVAGGLTLAAVYPQAFPAEITTSTPGLILAGVLVGFGTRLGSGCTSGHGVCGMSRISPRSFAATATFMTTGILAVMLVRHALGGTI